MADPVERYLELALRLGRHDADLIDAYYGPEELSRRVEGEEPREPAALAEDADALAEDVAGDEWLAAQVVALGANARKLAGERLGYAEEGRLVYGIEPRWHDEEPFRRAAAILDEALPGEGDVRERYARWLEETAIPAELVEPAVLDAAAELRRLTREAIGLPDGEEFDLELVTGERWLGYARYLGGLRTHIQVNTDLPLPAADLVLFDLARDLRRPPHASRLAGDGARARARATGANGRRALVAGGGHLRGRRDDRPRAAHR